ncbi:DNA repair protein rhp57 [Gnomoniopsis sp. IMI 355080]|nr:DNA repair protein rhp57 [Gnomoniopsis sp. IMI 355080]
MTDILRVLPQFPVSQYANLIPTLEKNQVTVTDLLTLEAADLGKRTQLPLLDLKRLCNAVLEALHTDLGVVEDHDPVRPVENQAENETTNYGHPLRHTLAALASQWSTISTLDPALDASLSGGVPTGTITEIAGEAGAGKTQLLLSLLLAVQLPPPHGTGRRALYISTEAPLSTRRLTQMLTHNPILSSLPKDQRPMLDNIFSTTTPDLESQEHILTYQVPVQVERSNIGLIILDSVAANYRAEFDRADGKNRGQGSNMGARSAELVRLGMLLRDLALKHNLAVVVSNQVADRFGLGSPVLSRTQPTTAPTTKTPYAAAAGGRSKANEYHGQESPLASRSKNPNPPPLPPIEPSSSMADALPRSSLSIGHEEADEESPPRIAPPPPPPPPPAEEVVGPPAPPALTFDHQQRWFTGWGDDPQPASGYGMKTPSLGLVWATQISCRIALFKAPRYGRSRYAVDDDDGGGGGVGVPTLKTWRRWAKVVFAPHVQPTGPGLEGAVEFDIGMGGIKSVVREAGKRGREAE